METDNVVKCLVNGGFWWLKNAAVNVFICIFTKYICLRCGFAAHINYAQTNEFLKEPWKLLDFMF